MRLRIGKLVIYYDGTRREFVRHMTKKIAGKEKETKKIKVYVVPPTRKTIIF